ncbi:plasmid partitioning protein RepA [Mesorhizobium sp.]|uniref:plasmid partitioning protein RepA n=1 Tax=Mesorhizobium sp. TaxID=1871066 RepID=UPI000FE36864|nr:plasmid partitioning protein RepA [Mesorhizobium sp.]RWN51520.1 MAG: plasmid partitioning protein RepA [Mesorhizobium sp.]RWN72159.1 MAG: plasmid partitioning protein RepA [Mesorhizobium sp.]RWN73380.1 MAG: plasmid partitioning protein RepA [Mesorhizobium sp.]RWN85691.1 MAG: plasmid partitioning protein RepA [Mesorhizobium sp.]RWO09421.1 MAG: plasmid partitioning protein RepA [Mesorhizobium sp.]
MNIAFDANKPLLDFDQLILKQGAALSSRLEKHRLDNFPPDAVKTLRQFQLSEVASYLGISPGYLKNLSLSGKGPQPTVTPTGRRSYTAEQMLEMRHYLDQKGRSDSRIYVPHRKDGEHLQIVAVVNFKGGSGKTTTTAHLAQHLALTGHRVLAIDLDPQASLTALHGIQPELDQFPSLYEAIRYDEHKKPIGALIRKTNFPGLDIIPANLELQEFEYDTPLILAEKGTRDMGRLFFTRLDAALSEVGDKFDVVVLDCPPQLGYLTLTALSSATAVLVTVHPQMLDVMSMCQFLLMLGEILDPIKRGGGNMSLDWMRYLVTRYEPGDVPQSQMVHFMRALFGDFVLKNEMVKSTAISDAGITKQTLYEVERGQLTRSTYDRALEALHSVNGEVISLIHRAWGRAS